MLRLDTLTGEGVSVEEVVIAAGAACDGRKVSEVAWPRDCVLASLRRGRQMLLPRGSTVLRAGDVLVAVAEGPARQAMRALCERPAAVGVEATPTAEASDDPSA